MNALRFVSGMLIIAFLGAACAPTATPTPAAPAATEAPAATSAPAATEAPAATAEPATAAPAASTLPDLGGKKIIVAVENAYPPFNFIDKATNQGAGWDYDAWTEICKLLNCVPVMTEAAWDGIFEATAAGQYDVVADGITMTDERKQKVAFSDSYMHYGQVILVRADETRFTDSKSLAALPGVVVASQLGTTNEKKAIEIVGEKNVKWLTRIEVADANAKGFYEAQGWGPDFIVPTRSRIDVPDDWTFVSLGKLTAPIEVKGVAFGGDRGISRVEISFNDGQTWSDAAIYYSGGNLAWSLWKTQWTPAAAGDYALVVRATDGEGDVQEFEEDRGPFSGTSGLHRINVRVTA